MNDILDYLRILENLCDAKVLSIEIKYLCRSSWTILVYDEHENYEYHTVFNREINFYHIEELDEILFQAIAAVKAYERTEKMEQSE